MAVLIRLLRADSLDELETIINEFFNVEAEDVRIVSSLAGGITFANGEYVAPVKLDAPHKRKFETVDEARAVQEKAATAEIDERAAADANAEAIKLGANANAGD